MLEKKMNDTNVLQTQNSCLNSNYKFVHCKFVMEEEKRENFD